MTSSPSIAPRSLLFVPALKQHYIEKAVRADPDAVVLDLEASIPDNRKKDARNLLPESIHTLKKAGQTVFVRVNRDDLKDYAMASEQRADGIVLPCVEQKTHIDDARHIASQYAHDHEIALLPIIETPMGLLNMRDIAGAEASPSGIMFGAEDFVLRLGSGVEPNESALFNAAWQVSVTAAAHQLPAYGIAGSIANFNDDVKFRRLCRQAKNIGMLGCAVIHPRQVSIVHDVFQPSPSEVDNARAVIKIFEEANFHTISLQGKMIDYPVYHRARALLQQCSGRK